MKRFLPALLCLLLLGGCGAAVPGNSPDLPPEETVQPTLCDGFGSLAWGAAPEELLGPDTPLEGARLDAGFHGHPGSAYYFFHPDTGLYGGYYAFNENQEESDPAALYQLLLRGLEGLYGPPDPTTSTMGEDGKMTDAPKIDDVIAGESNTAVDQWPVLFSSQGERVAVSLLLQPRGQIHLTYFRSPNQ